MIYARVRNVAYDVEENLIPLCPKCHSKQTVQDWEVEHQVTWERGGAHTYKGVI
jgi:hypothetical protein